MICGALTVTHRPNSLRVCATQSLSSKIRQRSFQTFLFLPHSMQHAWTGQTEEPPHGSFHHAAGLFGFGHETIRNGLSSETRLMVEDRRLDMRSENISAPFHTNKSRPQQLPRQERSKNGV